MLNILAKSGHEERILQIIGRYRYNRNILDFSRERGKNE
jgi:hypothetical protein